MAISTPPWLCDDMPQDVRSAVRGLQRRLEKADPAIRHTFKATEPLYVARAPGRLDVMGGIADYSGSLVLQWPLEQSSVALCQKTESSDINVFSVLSAESETLLSFHTDLVNFATSGQSGICSPEAARDLLKILPKEQRWVSYVLGTLIVLAERFPNQIDSGFSIYLDSKVPMGKGVSSSAAIEVSSMLALMTLFDIETSAHELAKLCQRVENVVVGAPCGLMDQMTSSAGIAGHLLTLQCQPDQLQRPTRLPEGLSVWGIDSGVSHSVAGSDYASVRTAAFMGYRLLLEAANPIDSRDSSVPPVDTRWGGFLANISVSDFEQSWSALLPEYVTGAEFLHCYQAITDPISTVYPDRQYAVRQCTAHPVYEHFRVSLFRQLCEAYKNRAIDSQAAHLMGECMYQSHASYSRCGLGSPETDDIVSRIRTYRGKHKIYGARISGGGSGGTVVVLAETDADDAVRQVAREYSASSERGGAVFSGTSDGAAAYTIGRSA